MAKEERKFTSPTIMDVAKETGVSYSTVSRALNGYEFVKASTRDKVLRAAEKMGYVPNQQARSLAGGRSNLIGVLVPGLTNGYISEIIRGIDEELTNSNYNLILYTTHRHHGRESSYVATIMNGAADGLILVVPLLSTAYLDALREQNFPYVLVDQSDTSEKSSIVNATNWQGAYDATRYLLELGHRRVGFIAGLPGLSGSAERLEGYRSALRDHQITVRRDYIAEGQFMESGGYTAAKKLMNLDVPPTAVFAANDMSAFGAMDAIRERGLKIPEDISIVGFDDIAQSAFVYPKLTTVRQPLEEMGRVGVRMLLHNIATLEESPRRTTLETELIVRESCQPPKTP